MAEPDVRMARLKEMTAVVTGKAAGAAGIPIADGRLTAGSAIAEEGINQEIGEAGLTKDGEERPKTRHKRISRVPKPSAMTTRM
jgi:hypothetical protein